MPAALPMRARCKPTAPESTSATSRRTIISCALIMTARLAQQRGAGQGGQQTVKPAGPTGRTAALPAGQAAARAKGEEPLGPPGVHVGSVELVAAPGALEDAPAPPLGATTTGAAQRHRLTRRLGGLPGIPAAPAMTEAGLAHRDVAHHELGRGG